MSFLFNSMLWGLGAVAVPIIIHLLNRRKFRTVTWAAMKFVKLSIDQNQRRMKLEDLILLLLRCAMLALLALALARPVMRDSDSTFIGQSGVTSVLVLDNSFSMGLGDGETTRFERAKAACTNILDSLPAVSSVALFLGSDVVRPVIEEPVFDLDAVREGVASAPLSDHATALFPAVESAVKKLEGSSDIRREVYVVTDDQALGWRQSDAMQKLLAKQHKKIRVHFVVVGGEAAMDNLGITALAPAEGLVTVGKPVRINVAVRNFSSREQPVTVSLRVGGVGGTISDVVIPSLAAGATQAFPFLITLERPGLHTVSATIIGGDRLPADNRRSIVINALKQVNVLVVNGDPKDDFFDDETKVLEAALAPAARGKEAEFYIRTVTRQARDLVGPQAQAIDWTAYRVVVLANVPSLSPDIVDQLARFVGAGNGLLVFPGSKIDEAFYNDELHGRLALLPAAFGGARGDAGQSEVYTTLQSANYEHSVVEMWNDPDSGSLGGREKGARFFQRQLLKIPRALAQSQLEEGGGLRHAAGDSGPFSGWVVGNEGESAERFFDGEKMDLSEDEIGLPQVVVRFGEGGHKLAAGENLGMVAALYGVTLESLEALNPTPLAEGGVVLLPAGQPAMAEHSWGLGRVYQFAYTADTEWGELPASPHSVPLYDKIIGSILLNQDAGLNLVAGLSFTRELGAVGANLQARVVAPGQAVDQAETVIVSTEEGQGTFRFGDTDRAGIYEVVYEYPEGTEETSEPPPPARFAVQPDTRESNMTALAPTTREAMAEHAGIHDWPHAGLSAALQRDRVGAEFWLPIVLLVLFLGALEIWLAQKFSRPK